MDDSASRKWITDRNQRIHPEWRHGKSHPCPRCGSTGRHCVTFPDGWIWCMHDNTGFPSKSYMGGYFHRTGDFEPEVRLHVLDSEQEVRASPSVLHAVYSQFLSLCGLDDGDPFGDNVFFVHDQGHLGDLLRRGFTREEIVSHQFASLDRDGRRQIAKQLLADCGDDILGHVPGLYLSRRGNTGDTRPDIAGRAGLLIPVRDVENRIVGILIACDDGINGPKYLWLSSLGKEGGGGPGAPHHHARPVGPVIDSRGYLFEGILKGTLAADRLGVEGVCLPGVNSCRGIVDSFRRMGKQEIVVAFDMDAQTNPTVLRARNAAATELAAAGFDVLLAEWDPAFKGIDDALLADRQIAIRPYPFKRRSGQLEPVVDFAPNVVR
jgi:hypothetical protein